VGNKGATGATGPTGNQGVVGNKGATGDQGPIGDQGPVGDKGPTGEGTLIVGMTTSSASTSSTSYMGPFLTTAPTEESKVQQVVPLAGKIANLAVKIGNDPGNSNSWTFTIRKNGASTGITCKIEGTSKTSCTSASSETFAAGDLLALQASPASGPDAWGSAHWAVTLTP
jgi:hypothetical protein